MKKAIALFILACADLFAADVIKVRLNASSEEVLLAGLNIRVNDQLICAPSQSCSLRIQAQESFFLLVTPETHQMMRLPNLKIKGKDLRLGSKRVPDELNLIKKKNRIDVIGLIPLDDYLVGVVSSEVPASWPLETLKAQVVASRSYTLATVKERENKEYHLESTIMDQVFHVPTQQKQKRLKMVKKAVRLTASEFLVSSNRKIIKAFYHADCGGQTKSAVDVWKMSQSFGVARDPFCAERTQSQWSHRVSIQDFQEKIRKLVGRPLQWLPHFDWSTASIQSHHQIVMREREQEVLIAANDLRKVVGFEKIKSTNFTVRKDSEGFLFRGVGRGHGVGLCQMGSWELGKRGYTYSEILKHYFPNAFLKKL